MSNEADKSFSLFSSAMTVIWNDDMRQHVLLSHAWVT